MSDTCQKKCGGTMILGHCEKCDMTTDVASLTDEQCDAIGSKVTWIVDADEWRNRDRAMIRAAFAAGRASLQSKVAELGRERNAAQKAGVTHSQYWQERWADEQARAETAEAHIKMLNAVIDILRRDIERLLDK